MKKKRTSPPATKADLRRFATKADFQRLEKRMANMEKTTNDQFVTVFDHVDRRFEEVDKKFKEMHAKFEDMKNLIAENFRHMQVLLETQRKDIIDAMSDKSGIQDDKIQLLDTRVTRLERSAGFAIAA